MRCDRCIVAGVPCHDCRLRALEAGERRSDKRRDLFWKQLERAAKDVAAWPDYLKRAFPRPQAAADLPRNLTHCATCDRPFPEPMTHWDDYFVEIEDAGFVCDSCPEVFE